MSRPRSRPAARVESESFRDDVSDGSDGENDLVRPTRAVPLPPRPTSVPGLVLSGTRVLGGGEGGRIDFARTHPSLDLPQGQTHLTPMQQWELRKAKTNRLPPPNSGKRTESLNPRFALQRQHDFALRQHARDASLDASYEQTVRPSPATQGLRDAETVRRSETRAAAAAAAAAARKLRNDEGSDFDATYASSDYASPPPAVVDPFVSAFVSAMRDDEDEDETDNSRSDADVDASETSDRSPGSPEKLLQTPFLDALVLEVMRPKGSVLPTLRLVDALWDGTSIATLGSRADESASANRVRIATGTGTSSRGKQQTDTAVHTGKGQGARRFLERRLLKCSSGNVSRSRSNQSPVVKNPPQQRFTRYVADYEVVDTNHGNKAGDEAAAAAAVVDAEETYERLPSGDDANAFIKLPPFESLPLHFSTKDRRVLYHDFDFKPLAPQPPAPRAVLANAFAGMGIPVTSRTFRKRKSGDKNAGESLTQTSDRVVFDLESLIRGLRLRETAYQETRKRASDEQLEKVKSLSKKVHDIELDARATFQIFGDDAELKLFDDAAHLAVSQTVSGVMESTRWWYGSMIRTAATTIQSGFRGMTARKIARIKRKGLNAGRRYVKRVALQTRFELWHENAKTQKRHDALLRVATNKRDWGLRIKCFKAWRTRTKLGVRFHKHVDRLARVMRVKYHEAPLFVEWRAVTENRVWQRKHATKLVRSANRRYLGYNFGKWSANAASSARGRILDTAQHAQSVLEATKCLHATDLTAAAAWRCAAAASDKAAAGEFAEARRFAERARELCEAAALTCAESEKHAGEAGHDSGPRSRARLAYRYILGLSQIQAHYLSFFRP